MINLDKILGGIVQTVVSSALSHVVSPRTARQTGMKIGKIVSHLVTKAIGIGSLGVAIAAYEHFKDAGLTPFPPPQPLIAEQSTGSDNLFSISRPPPPPPKGNPYPAQESPEEYFKGSSEALVLLRTIIAAASSDGAIDSSEQKKIVESLAKAGLSKEEETFVEDEFTKPHSIEEL